ncbi:MAG: Isoquinoline 1-oxidoreductase subunit [Pseudomonadota bacterium]
MIRSVIAALATGSLAALLIVAVPRLAAAADGQTLRTVADFVDIEDDEARAAALFGEMFKVISHPRCMNCHPVDARPRQGEDMALHMPPVVRGEGGFGVAGMRCSTCHGAENASFVGAAGSMPGHEHWHLAPASMGWTGMTQGEVCAQLKDPERNGNRTLAEVHEHMAKDGLVGWAWSPGEGRAPAPGDQALLGALTAAWVDAGAHCPTAG